jgi:hypothetical protein
MAFNVLYDWHQVDPTVIQTKDGDESGVVADESIPVEIACFVKKKKIYFQNKKQLVTC